MQEKAYQICKNFLENHVKYKKEYQETGHQFFLALSEDYRQNYKGAVDVYEALFNTEFVLNENDRKRILSE